MMTSEKTAGKGIDRDYDMKRFCLEHERDAEMLNMKKKREEAAVQKRNCGLWYGVV